MSTKRCTKNSLLVIGIFTRPLLAVAIVIEAYMASTSAMVLVGIPTSTIALVLAIYASITIATANRGRVNIPITNREFFVHLLVDIFFFSTLLYLSCGASNPFISYYLISISIAAIVLPPLYTGVIALTTLLCYSLLLSFHIPVSAIAPHDMGHSMAGNNLHIWGMWAHIPQI